MNALKLPTIFTAVDKASATYDKIISKTESLTKKLKTVTNYGAGVGLALLTSIGVATKSSVTFEDAMADVQKTTGMSDEMLRRYSESMLDYSGSTRTLISDLSEIGAIGGQLGIAEKDMVSFTQASDKFAVALKRDYGDSVEEAVSSVGKTKLLYKETRNLDISDVILKVGSAFNELGNTGSATAQNVNDFVLRMGGLPDALKPSITDVSALGASLQELGINSEKGASGLKNMLQIASKNMPRFAKQMGLTQKEAKNLIDTDPTQFVLKLSQSLSKFKGSELGTQLAKLKLNSNEVIAVVGAFGSNVEFVEKKLKTAKTAFEENTSILKEYETKNNTTAGEVNKLQNKIENLKITIGNNLLPVIRDLISEYSPLIQQTTTWIKENSWAVEWTLKLAIALVSLRAIMTAMPILIALYNIGLGLYTALLFKNSLMLKGNTIALMAYKAMSYGVATAIQVWTGVQWLLNAALTANPIGIVVVLIGLLIGAVILIIAKWDSWGETLTNSLGPLGWIIKFIKDIVKYWDYIADSFKEGGILEGFKAIGKVVLNAILTPIKKVLSMLTEIPVVGKLAQKALDGIDRISPNLPDIPEEVIDSVSTEEPALDSVDQLNNQKYIELLQQAQSGKSVLDINLNDPNSLLSFDLSGNAPVELKPTF